MQILEKKRVTQGFSVQYIKKDRVEQRYGVQFSRERIMEWKSYVQFPRECILERNVFLQGRESLPLQEVFIGRRIHNVLQNRKIMAAYHNLHEGKERIPANLPARYLSASANPSGLAKRGTRRFRVKAPTVLLHYKHGISLAGRGIVPDDAVQKKIWRFWLSQGSSGKENWTNHVSAGTKQYFDKMLNMVHFKEERNFHKIQKNVQLPWKWRGNNAVYVIKKDLGKQAFFEIRQQIQKIEEEFQDDLTKEKIRHYDKEKILKELEEKVIQQDKKIQELTALNKEFQKRMEEKADGQWQESLYLKVLNNDIKLERMRYGVMDA
ncbi:hypothetical protein D7V86_01675 [bacterium D16-51]|nr:hypothetical protein D7V86_01675 [bacterium D16-51]